MLIHPIIELNLKVKIDYSSLSSCSCLLQEYKISLQQGIGLAESNFSSPSSGKASPGGASPGGNTNTNMSTASTGAVQRGELRGGEQYDSLT